MLNSLNFFGYSITTGEPMPTWWGKEQPTLAERWASTEEGIGVWAHRMVPTHTTWINKAEKDAESNRTKCQSKSKAKWRRIGKM